MKKIKLIIGAGAFALIGLILFAADHIEAPDVKGGSSDITDFYAFQAEDTDNLVFVANIQGLLSPTATSTAKFDENVLIEFNIDTDLDYIEDLVIQAIPRNGKMYFFGPYEPSATGLNSSLPQDGSEYGVSITPYGSSPMIGAKGAMKFFAGPRDDPFFMDFAKYGEIIGGTASGFDNPGSDTFKETNVLSVVVELPKLMVGGSGTINTWVETKAKQ
ncbi:DUF4331 family protein [Tenacibaculum sp. AHE15PA]|uniref:DUF4331 family protein n=1 Tax=unclassified Tenacibaculum TaxID=2635139 RepID=UPI001C4EFC10|nr:MULTISPECIES: DUF4331 family protein [unclassified Tenacibaculum]QXP74604.1 DUF4331 family protein [Tenacibaculum sp. AHE14PA]QXP76115.1 DUF4331 family protein [Tenacibaculum sp. AHE15PA]